MPLIEPRRFASVIALTFFVDSPRAGAAAVLVLAIAAPHLALSGIAVAIAARLVARRIGASQALLASGLVELNGWFLGLACATFFSLGPGLLFAIVAAGPLVAVMTVVSGRVLATWDVPILVGPYVPAFWLLWNGLGVFPWSAPAQLPSPPMPELPAVAAMVVAGLRGVGQIFFCPDALVGLGLALAASLADRRLGPLMVASSVCSVAIGQLAGAPAWQVQQGLAGFTPAMVAAAALCGFVGLGRTAVLVSIVAAPFLEAAALRIGGAVGLPALSLTYVGLVWLFALLRPVRDASAARGAWSSGPGAPRARTRLFED